MNASTSPLSAPSPKRALRRHTPVSSVWGCILACYFGAAFATESALDDNSSTRLTTPEAKAKAAYLAPPADLEFDATATQYGLHLSGRTTIRWRPTRTSYKLFVQTTVSWFGSVIESESEGTITDAGIVPRLLTETRYKKNKTKTLFEPEMGYIVFDSSKRRYTIKGGEQDHISVVWQLMAAGNAAPSSLLRGGQLPFFVAGQYDADEWIFESLGTEPIFITDHALPVQAIHLHKIPTTYDENRQYHFWLAPNLQWIPVRIQVTDKHSEMDQILSSYRFYGSVGKTPPHP